MKSKMFGLFMILIMVGSLCTIMVTPSPVFANVDTPSVTPTPATANSTANYAVSFSPGTSGTLSAGNTVTVTFPTGTTVPTSISYTNVFITTSGTTTATNPAFTGVAVSNKAVTVAIPTGYGVSSAGTMTITFSQLAGIKNPPLSSHAADNTSYRITVSTSKDTTPVVSEPYTIDDWITASPMALAKGDPVTVSGGGFKPGASIVLSATDGANTCGAVSGPVVVQSDGTFTITGYGTGVAGYIKAEDSSGRSALTSSQTTVLPRLSVSPWIGPVGTYITITGCDYCGLPIAVSIGGVVIDTTGLTLIDVDGDGILNDFVLQTTIPPGLSDGHKIVQATNPPECGATVATDGFEVGDGQSLRLQGGGSYPKAYVAVTGGGFSPNAGGTVDDVIQLVYNPTDTAILAAGISTDISGVFTAMVQIPADASPGVYTLEAIIDGEEGSISLQVTESPPRSIEVFPVSGPPGTYLCISGSGFPSNSSSACSIVLLPASIDNAYSSDWISTDVFTDSTGSFVTSVIIPSDAPLGVYRVIAFIGGEPAYALCQVTSGPLVEISVEPASGQLGAPVTISGSGLTPNGSIPAGDLKFGGMAWNTVPILIDSNGDLVPTPMTIPFVAPLSTTYAVTVTDTGGRKAACTFAVLPPTEVWVDDDWAGTPADDDPDGPDGPAIAYGYDAFSAIQLGVDGVSSGGTVHVGPGTYFENVDVSKPVTIESVSGDPVDTIVIGVNPDDDVFHASADSVTIRGFSACGATQNAHAGIYVAGTDYCTIENNRCGWDATHYNCHGITLSSAAHNTVSNNLCSYNAIFGGVGHGAGILVMNSSSENIISLNMCSANSSGIVLAHSNLNEVLHNTCASNIGGIVDSQGERNNVHHNGVSHNIYGLVLYLDATNNTVENNNITENTGYALYNYQSYDAMVGRNYWGDAPNMGALIYDKNDDPSLGLVTYGEPLPNPVGLSVVDFPDPNLEAAIRDALNKPTGDITDADLAGLSYLDASSRGITDLSGLEYCTALTDLPLYDNQISTIAPLAGLTNLTYLWLSDNQITDISPLVANTGLGSGDTIDIASNPLSADSYGSYIPQLQARGATVTFDPANTSSGSNVVVDLADGTTITFDNVTSPGSTVAIAQADPDIGNPNFSVLGGRCYEILTGAAFTGTVLISLPYDETQINVPEDELKLLHYENGSWVDVTVSVDTVGNTITGQVTSLSPFVIVQPVAATVDILLTLQGSSRPDPAGWQVPVTVRLFAPGANVLHDAPLYEFNLTANKSGNVTACQTGGVVPGTYDITVVSEHTLMNVKRNVVISAPDTSVDMGTLLEGDWNGNLTIDWEDLGTILLTYDKCEGVEGFDPAADFNRSGSIDWEDLGLVLINYDKTSPVEVP